MLISSKSFVPSLNPTKKITYLKNRAGCLAASLRQAMFASYILFSVALPGAAFPSTVMRRWVMVSSYTESKTY